MKQRFLGPLVWALPLVVIAQLAISALLPSDAVAQPFLGRYWLDPLTWEQAEARVLWARRCALTRAGFGPQDHLPSWYFPTLRDYTEPLDDSHWPPGNNYMGYAFSADINYTTIALLYRSWHHTHPLPTESLDANGYVQWARARSYKLTRPYYPTYGTTPGDYPNWVQLYPHPSHGNDCSFYYDAAGTQPANVPVFYVGAFVTP